MKAVIKTLPWALLLARAYAQDYTSDDTTATTAVDDDNDTVTSYYTLCPNSTTSTTAPSGTITGSPNELTKTGDDGRTTIYRTETTILPHLCPNDEGVCGATYTLSKDCPCTAEPKTIWAQGECPEGFTVTAVECAACAHNGGPATVTVTIPQSDGLYATVTPKYGSPVNHPSDICTDETPEQTGVPSSWVTIPAQPSGPEDRYDNPPANHTQPSYEPYTGAAGRLDIGACVSIIGAGIIGALAIFL